MPVLTILHEIIKTTYEIVSLILVQDQLLWVLGRRIVISNVALKLGSS